MSNLTSAINVNVPTNVKEEATNLFNSLGISMSVAINMFIKSVLREHRLPFEIKTDPFYSKSNIEYLEKVVSDIKSGKAKFIEHELIEDDDSL